MKDMKMKYKAIFIDIDNTLLDFDEYVKESLKNGFKEFGICEYDDSKYEIFERENTKLWRDLENKLITFEELKAIRFNKVFEALGVSFDGVKFETYFRNFLNKSAIPVKGAMELIEYLKTRYIVCLASNGPFDQQVGRIRLARMDKFTDYYFISEDIGHSKPSEAYFDECMNRLNKDRANPISKEECIMIGDSLTADIKGGMNYGMNTIYFIKKGEGSNISSITPTYTVKELIEIKNIL